jgi:hypothetical protein
MRRSPQFDADEMFLIEQALKRFRSDIKAIEASRERLGFRDKKGTIPLSQIADGILRKIIEYWK